MRRFNGNINFDVNVGASQDTGVEALPAYAGDAGSIPESGRSLAEGMGIHFGILSWRIPWTEEPGRLQSWGSQRDGHD